MKEHFKSRISFDFESTELLNLALRGQGHFLGSAPYWIDFSNPTGVPLHKDVVGPFLKLQERGHKLGFDLHIASGYRDYERQLRIWNGKARGERPVLDDQNNVLKIEDYTDEEWAFHILRYSSIPGAGRHHWGTEMDVYDKAAMPEGYKLQLTPDEVAPEGIFGPLHAWLDEVLKEEDCPFYRPYQNDRKGVAPELWHLSFHPLSSQFARHLGLSFFKQTLEDSPIELKEVLLKNAATIYQRFVLAP